MEETVERLLSDLEEAKGSFDIIIENMKAEGKEYPYYNLLEKSLRLMGK